MIATLFSFAFVAQVLIRTLPTALAAIGGATTERSGVVDLALEAKLLFGAFAAAAIGHATHSPYLGVAAGMAAGALVAMIQLGCALRLGADQVVVGIALNVVALGGTRFLLQLLYHEGANSPPTPGFRDAVLASPIFWIAVIAAVATPFALRRTRWGVRLRAAGDRPDALVAVGVSPMRARLAAGVVGGALAGAGGAQLALSVGGFVADMSGGRGYYALAMVILSGWRPAWAAVAYAGLAAVQAFSVQLQLHGVDMPSELVDILPHVLTVVVLIVIGPRSRPPAALGKS